MTIKPEVSEHATLRYLSRIKGVDLEAIKAEMLSPLVVAAIKAGAVAVKIGGVDFRVRNGVIVTTIDRFNNTRKNNHRRFQNDPGELRKRMDGLRQQEIDEI